MTGQVDDNLRALIRVPVSATREGERSELSAWIDTGFNGDLVIPRAQATRLGLKPSLGVEALLADGQSRSLDTCLCFFDWFGRTYESVVVVTDSTFPLLGTRLLDGRRLTVDYRTKSVRVQ